MRSGELSELKSILVRIYHFEYSATRNWKNIQKCSMSGCWSVLSRVDAYDIIILYGFQFVSQLLHFLPSSLIMALEKQQKISLEFGFLELIWET